MVLSDRSRNGFVITIAALIAAAIAIAMVRASPPPRTTDA
ncbi:hypothetical protein LG3211_0242 [Lysobacter gummosus]|nr:hypothetical protein LG3211_0242 [Lysobacter gummosus]